MAIKAATLTLAILLPGCAMVGIVPTPPEEYRGEVITQVYFADDVTDACVRIGDPGVAMTLAIDAQLVRPLECFVFRKRTLILENPCHWPDPTDGYAKLACHGIGHVNGAVHGPDGGYLGWSPVSAR